MTDIVERARELVAGITPGPWTKSDSYHDIWANANTSDAKVVASFDPRPECANADFIAAAPELVRELMETVDRVERLVAGFYWSGYTTPSQLRAFGHRLCDALENK